MLNALIRQSHIMRYCLLGSLKYFRFYNKSIGFSFQNSAVRNSAIDEADARVCMQVLTRVGNSRTTYICNKFLIMQA